MGCIPDVWALFPWRITTHTAISNRNSSGSGSGGSTWPGILSSIVFDGNTDYLVSMNE